jgi:hypothetical protein
MKRLLMIAILLFPVGTLLYWVFRGDTMRHEGGDNLPSKDWMSNNAASSAGTNLTNAATNAPLNALPAK